MSESSGRVTNDDEIEKISFETSVLDRDLKIMLQIMEMMVKKAVIEGSKRNEPVLRFRNPAHLKKIFSFELEEAPCTNKRMIEVIEDIIVFSTKTGHPRYFYQFSGGLDVYGLIGSWLTDALIVNTFTYDCAPVFTLMEKYILQYVSTIFGFPENSEGIFCPGGSLANGFAMNLARNYQYPDIKFAGMNSKNRLVVFVSEDVHYSIYKMAGLLGIGEQNVIPVTTDELGRMNTAHLKQLLESYAADDECQLLMVVATAGTTVLGAFDPLEEVATLCAEYKLWLHVDAAWGGAAILSDKYKKNLYGIERADSFVWNPSKILAVPQQCSMLCVRHPELMAKAHSFGASYLFRRKFYDSCYDLGDSYLQCGRKTDVLKLWLMWKAKGQNGVKKHVNAVLNKAEYLAEQIRKHPNFELVCEPSFVNVCFWYIPDSLKNRSICEIRQDINEIAPNVEEKMLRNGTIMISSQSMRELPNFFRFVCCNSSVINEDCDYLLSEIKNIVDTSAFK